MDEMSTMLSNSSFRNIEPRRIHAIALGTLLVLPMSSPVWSDSDLPEASESQPPARIELIDQTVVYGEITDIRDGELDEPSADSVTGAETTHAAHIIR